MEKNIKVSVTRSFDCSATRLFDWLVEPTLIPKWFGPKNVSVGRVDIDLKVGGQYRIELIKLTGQSFLVEGSYLEIEKPYKLVYGLKYGGLPTPPPNSIVEITLAEISPNNTTLTLVQRFEEMPTDMENRTKAWNYMIEKLNNEIGK